MPRLLESGVDAHGEASAAAEIVRAPVKDGRSTELGYSELDRGRADADRAQPPRGVRRSTHVQFQCVCHLARGQQLVVHERAHARERPTDPPGQHVHRTERWRAVPAFADPTKRPVVAKDPYVLFRDPRLPELASADDAAVRVDEALMKISPRRPRPAGRRRGCRQQDVLIDVPFLRMPRCGNILRAQRPRSARRHHSGIMPTE